MPTMEPNADDEPPSVATHPPQDMLPNLGFIPPERSPSNSRSKASTHVSVACDTCRRRKSKCSGERPRCSFCVKRGLECHYEPTTLDDEQIRAAKRKYSELQDEAEAYDELYHLLQTASDAQVQEILAKLRLGEDPAYILRQMKYGDLQQQLALVPETRLRYTFPCVSAMPAVLLVPDNPYLGSLMYESTAQDDDDSQAPLSEKSVLDRMQPAYGAPYHAAIVVEPLISTVTTSRWTSVISDDELLRVLLRSYILHDYSNFPAFQMQIFLQAMADGTRELCSPLLVNAVLTEACHCFRGIPNRGQFWNPRALGSRFLAEAKRLWDFEIDEIKLTNLQAAVVLHVCYSHYAMEVVGNKFLARAISIAQKLGIFELDCGQVSPDMKHSREFTAWCLYRWQTVNGFNFGRPSSLEEAPKVPLPDPDEKPEWYGEISLKYPASEIIVPSHHGHIFRAVCELRAIITDISVEMFRSPNQSNARDVDGALSVERVHYYLQRLGEWFESLAPPLSAKTIVLPSQLRVHLEYQSLRLTLCQVLDTRQCLPTHTLGWPDPDSAENMSRNSSASPAICLETIARLYYLRHSFEYCDGSLTYFLSILAMLTLRNISANPRLSIDDPRRKLLQSTLILAIKGLFDQGRNVHLSFVAARLLQSQLSAHDLAVLSTYTSEDEASAPQPIVPEHARSEWPIAIITPGEDLEKARIINLVKEYDTVSLNPEGVGSS